MSELFAFCPTPPDWRLPWDDLDRAYPWVRALAGCPQDPVHHAEGDVWIHTRMVVEELLALSAWRALPEDERRVLFAAAVLHDVGKPDCTRAEDGRITSRGHSRRGANLGRQILWHQAAPFAMRERVCNLVRYHQVPYFLLDRDDPRRLCLEISQSARCDHLALLAEADVRGRTCDDKQRLLDNVGLFAEYAREEGCLDAPFAFPDDHTRVVYFREGTRPPEVPVWVKFRAEVVMLSGLPGAGKDHFLTEHLADWPVVSLDELRTEMDIDPDEDQGAIVQAARERARDHLGQGRSFVWNATNVSRLLRDQVLRLFLDYDAHVRIVYLEVPPEVQLRQNKQRAAVVPEKVLARILDRWEVPDRCEAHEVEYRVRVSPD